MLDAMSHESDFEVRRHALIAEITAAFRGVSRDGGTTLHEADAIDARKSSDEQSAARRLDLETRWQDVREEDIFACREALSFLDEKGFRYYIPAFMICGLRHWKEQSHLTSYEASVILSTSEYHLLHDYPKSLRASEPASIASKYQFTGAQSRAVARFLRLIIDFDEVSADKATVEAVHRWENYAI